MKLRSLGYRTDLIFSRFDGSVTDRGDYLVVRTDSNPNYFWGNFLIMNRPPAPGDLGKWKEAFRREFTDPRIYHLTFGWDSPEGDLGFSDDFVADGFRLERNICLVAESVHLPPKPCPELSVRPVRTDEEWEEVIRIQLACAQDHLSLRAWEEFHRNQVARYRAMIRAGRGDWFGGWLNDRMVGSLGLFRDGDLGRYQYVSVDPDHRRKGVCGTLVFTVGEIGFREWGLRTQVMIADEEYHAARIYESVGFQPAERMAGLCWWDKSRTD